jgi:hypothetical protein
MDECGSFFLVEKPILQGGVGYHGWKWILFKALALVIMDESKSLEVQGSFLFWNSCMIFHFHSHSLNFVKCPLCLREVALCVSMSIAFSLCFHEVCSLIVREHCIVSSRVVYGLGVLGSSLFFIVPLYTFVSFYLCFVFS